LLVSSYFSGVVPDEIRALLPSALPNRDDLVKLLRRDIGGVNREYIHNIAALKKRDHFMRIGVTHHNPIGYGSETCQNPLAPLMLETLFRNGTKVLVHGHVHLSEDRGAFRPMPMNQSYSIPAPTLCSECVSGSRGFLIHFIGEEMDSKCFDSVLWEVAASSNFNPNQVRIAYRIRIKGAEAELIKPGQKKN
jgi:hypothetical protein